MSLGNARIWPTIAVSDMEKAKQFYGETLGLTAGAEQADGGIRFSAGEGSVLHVYPSPDNAGTSGATVAGWEVADVEKEVDELISKGVTFEQYGEPLNTNEKGIAELGGDKGAWFKDPDGNILGIGTFSD